MPEGTDFGGMSPSSPFVKAAHCEWKHDDIQVSANSQIHERDYDDCDDFYDSRNEFNFYRTNWEEQ